MATKRLCAWCGLAVLLAVGAVPIVGWAVLGGGEEPAYQTGDQQTYRGEIIPLPGERFWVGERAYYAGDGTAIFVYASGGTPGHLSDDLAGGCWMMDLANGTETLIHNNYNGDLWWGASLCQLGGLPSPDGQYLAALEQCYSEAARSIERDDPDEGQRLRDAFQSYRWVLIEVTTGEYTVLMDLTEEYNSPQAVWTPRGYVWLDSERLAFVREAPDPDGTAVYTLGVGSGQIDEVIVEPPGSYVAHLRRVSDGKILYYLQSAEAVTAIQEYMDGTALEHRDPAVVKELLNAETSLKLVDLRGEEPVVSTLDFGTAEVDLRDGELSPNERFYAFRTAVRGTEETRCCLAIAAVGSEQVELLENEISNLCEWHPDGDKVLVVLEPEYPADRPGVLAEIWVADVCEALSQ